LKVKRRRKEENEGYLKFLGTRVTPEIYEKIEKIAIMTGRTKTEVLRELIAKGIYDWEMRLQNL
jgi:predicted DNA-binding protein